MREYMADIGSSGRSGAAIRNGLLVGELLAVCKVPRYKRRGYLENLVMRCRLELAGDGLSVERRALALKLLKVID